MKLLKLPDGPIPQGAGAGRSLDGVSWQRKVGADYVAHRKHNFTRITGGSEINYLSYGVLDGSATNKTFGSKDYRTPFAAINLNAGITCDLGKSAYGYYGALANTSVSGTYPGAYVGDTNTTVTFTVVNATQQTLIGSTLTSAVSAATYSYSNLLLYNGYFYLYANPVGSTYCGRVNLGLGNEVKLISFYTKTNGRYDGYGRALLDIACRLVYSKSPSVETFLPLYGHTNGEYGEPSKPCVASNCIYLFIHERFTWVGAVTAGVDLRPKFWIYMSTDGGASWTANDVRTTALADLDIPKMRVAQYTPSGPDGAAGYFLTATIPLASDGSNTITDTTNYSHTLDYEISHGPPATYGTRNLYSFIFSDGYKYNNNMSYVALDGKWVMCAGNVALYAFSYRKTVSGSYVWASKILRIDGLSVSVAFLSTTTGSTTEYIEHMIYVGNQTIIAKKVLGFGGTGFGVVFMKSTDNGVTWSTFAPTGFLCGLTNENFGDFFLERAEADPHDAAKPPVLLITSWDASKLEYHVFESKDYGATWASRGKIGKPNAFYRIDTMLATDGGDCFRVLDAAEARLRKHPLDLALPTRYVRKP